MGSSKASIHGGRVVARALREEGIPCVFTLCGGHVQAIYDGCIDEGIRVVDVRHEQTAAHAADGWARVTGDPGVAIVTAGPGVTGTVTAAANALRAQVPMVIIGGQGARAHGPMGGQDRGSLQEMNHLELMTPVTKWARSVPETRRLAEYVHSAFRVAVSGVPGPVFIEVPLDVLMNFCGEGEVLRHDNPRTPATAAGDPEQVELAARAMASAERPLLLVGSQWRWSRYPRGLHDLLSVAPMPTYLNGMARGALPPGHRCAFRWARSPALRRADCVVVCGTPMDFRLGYGSKIAAGATVIQVDLDGAIIGLNRGADVGVVGDTGRVLGQLADALGGARPKDWEAWREEVSGLQQDAAGKSRAEAASDAVPLSPLRVCAELNRFVDEETIVVGDGGDFVATAAYMLDVWGPGSWMDPGPLGTLGVGPGFAMAAKLARPSKKVILLLGDGTFGFSGMEFEAMARQGIDVVGVVGNDACWSQIHRGQVAIYGPDRAVATTLEHTRYDRVVAGLGGHGEYVERAGELAPAMERALSAGVPALVNVKIGRSDFRKGALSV